MTKATGDTGDIDRIAREVEEISTVSRGDILAGADMKKAMTGIKYKTV